MNTVELKLQELRERYKNEPENRVEIANEAKRYKCCKCEKNIKDIGYVVCEDHVEKRPLTQIKKVKTIEDIKNLLNNPEWRKQFRGI